MVHIAIPSHTVTGFIRGEGLANCSFGFNEAYTVHLRYGLLTDPESFRMNVTTHPVSFTST